MSQTRSTSQRGLFALLRTAWWVARWVRPLAIWQAIRYARWRDQVEARWCRTRENPSWEGWGEATEATRLERGLKIAFTGGDLELLFLAPDLVRVSWYPGPEPPPYAVAKPPDAWPRVAFEITETDTGWRVQTEAMTVAVTQAGTVRFLDREGRLLREDEPPHRAGERRRLRTRLHPEERVYGLGERATHANRRGGRYVLWNRDPDNYTWGEDPLYLNVPVYFTLHPEGSYLVFFENPYRAVFDVGETQEDTLEHTFEGGLLRYYFIPGPPPRALERYTELTGRPPLPPLWALGYHQSRYSYYPERRVRELVTTFQEHDIPLDVVHLDIHYMHGYRVFTWDRERFPDPKRLAKDLRDQGVRIITIIDPGVKVDPKYPVYREGVEGGHFCGLPDGTPVHAPVWPGWCAFPDFTDAAARAWWGNQYRKLLDVGVAGFWHDMNEPVVFAAWGEHTFPLCTRHALDGQGGDHAVAHNLYGLLMARAAYEGLRRLAPDRRPLIISRSGWAGLQRYAWNWTGDNFSDWASFYLSIPMLIGLGLSGIAFTGPDIGGFQGAPTPELYTRWLQAGIFFPFCRTHTCIDTPDQEPWSYGEPYTRINRETIRWRYRLLLYLYTAAWQSAMHSWPLVRPLWWVDPEDATLWDVDDAFLCGDALLVAPVLVEGSRWRRVWLPRGLWYDFWTGTAYTGGREVEVDAPLDYSPVFVRGGTVLPLLEPAANTDRLQRDRVTLRVYPPAREEEGISWLYVDEGEGWRYTEGHYTLQRFHMAWDEGALVVRWAWQHEGKLPWPFSEVIWEWAGAEKVARVACDGAPVAAADGRLALKAPCDTLRWELAS